MADTRDVALLGVGSIAGIAATLVTVWAFPGPVPLAGGGSGGVLSAPSLAAPELGMSLMSASPPALADLVCQPMCTGDGCPRGCKLRTRQLTVGLTSEAGSAATLDFLKGRKRHDVALLTGTGLSAGRLTESQAAFLQRTADVWAMNQFFLHKDLVPDFYMVEVGRMGNVSSLDWWRGNFGARKRLAYADTVFLTSTRHVTAVRALLTESRPCPRDLVVYEIWQVRERNCRRLRRLAFHPRLVTDFCASSVSRLLHLMLNMAYTDVWFVGIDLTSPRHFYTALPAYESVRVPRYEALVVAKQRKTRNSQPAAGLKVHATAERGIGHFLGLFHNASGMGLVNLNPSSLLAKYRFIRTVDVGELHHEWLQDRRAAERARGRRTANATAVTLAEARQGLRGVAYGAPQLQPGSSFVLEERAPG